MKLFIGLDVSLARTAVCVTNEHGKIVKETEGASAPEARAHFTGTLSGKVAVIGLEAVTLPMLKSRDALRQELANLEREVRGFAKRDPVCRLLMAMPMIGAAVDDPSRSSSSKRVGPWAGLTPSRHQSREHDVIGGITKAGDVNLRRALCQAATVMLHRARPSWLRTWAAQVAKRRESKRAMVALARRIGVVLHRMWRDSTEFNHATPPIVGGI